MKRMIALDGAQGEGGGQIMRSALSLSMITGQPFTITGISCRAGKTGTVAPASDGGKGGDGNLRGDGGRRGAGVAASGLPARHRAWRRLSLCYR